MKNLEYISYDFADPLFPIAFNYYIQKKDESFTPHWHTHIELLYFLIGEAKIIIDQDEILAESGDIIIVNVNSVHSIESLSEESHYYSLVLDSKFCMEQKFDTLNHQFRNKTQDLEMRNIFQIIGNEMHQAKRFHQDAVRALSITMLILLFRNQVIARKPRLDTHSPQVMYVKEGIEFIHQNFHQDISINDIACYVGISKYHFSRIFKDITSVTINQYINSLRCNHARQLVLSSELSIGEIAEKTGFKSTSYFSKTYRKFFQVSPSQARKDKRHK